jgi:hypothetical protein
MKLKLDDQSSKMVGSLFMHHVLILGSVAR